MSTRQIAFAHFDPKTFNSVFRLPQPRGINETKWPFAAIDHGLQRIACRAGNFRYNRPGSAQKRIEERGLSNVRRARDDYDCTIADDLTG